uniref:Major facilitator superfamily (MFS) profile domain-containing protein n=1 Tax=Amphimedon queenslandica TaxID=400682 RepID=A0A1X7UN88_AMPQE
MLKITIFTIIALVLEAAGLLVCGYFSKSKFDSVLYLSLTVGAGALIQAGFMINHIDLAPRFAGVLMGITNTFGTIPGIVAPVVAKYMAQEPPSGSDVKHIYQEEWRKVFLISVQVYIFGAAVYLILADGKKQWWADGVKKERKDSSIQ